MRADDSHRRKERRGQKKKTIVVACFYALSVHFDFILCVRRPSLRRPHSLLFQHQNDSFSSAFPFASPRLFPSIPVRNDGTNAVRRKGKLQQSKHRNGDELHSRRPRRGHRGCARQFAARMGRWRHRR
jgi:hypothetical protein